MAYQYYPYQQQPYYPQPVQGQLEQLRQQQYQPVPQTMPQAAPQMQPGNGIIWVQGAEGAKAYMVAPGSTVLLMDSDGSSFYLKSADASGMPQPLRIFDYVERTAAPAPVMAAVQNQPDYITRAEFAALEARIDALTAKDQKPSKKSNAKEPDDNG